MLFNAKSPVGEEDTFLPSSGPSASTNGNEPMDQGVYIRAESDYQNCSERFTLKQRQFSRQFAHIYSVRLQQMRSLVTVNAKKKWGANIEVKKLHQLSGEDQSVVVAGTLFKHMTLKPNILKEISDEHNLIPQPIRSRYSDEKDVLILEDELQRIILIGKVNVQSLVTGVVVAVKGNEIEGGKFAVEDICFSVLPEQIPRTIKEEDMYVALVCGLGLGTSADCLFPLQLMIDFLAGELGDQPEQEASAKVVRLIVAGNSLSKSTQDKEFTNKAKYLTRNIQASSVDAVKALDDFLVQLAGALDVDIMAGEYDPANYVLPQQPMHGCMFPKAMKYSTMQCVTNPYDCTIGSTRFLGTSGQNVDDIRRYSELYEPLEIMERTLEWGHLAPTAPDTLGCYPFYETDPFIMSTCPDVYFVGNQPKFDTRFYTGAGGQVVNLVSIPRFADSYTCVLVNLRNLECQPVVFDDSYLEG